MKLEKLIESKLERVVAAEPGYDGEAEIFIREDGKIRSERIPFHPFLLLNNPALLNGLEEKFDIISLGGKADYAYQAVFPNAKIYDNAIKFLKKNTGFNPSAPNSPYKLYSDRTQQLFISNEFRLFRGMNFSELHRMQLDIETVCAEGYDFSNPERDEDEIVIISLSDNQGWEMVLHQDPMSEKELLEKCVEVVKERDPDVIEGHNLFRFDLPYIETRAKRHKMKLQLGRSGKGMKSRNSRFTAAERTINYTRYDIYGRHVVDTYHLVQLYDVSHRDLEGYGLKDVARHFGVSPENRTYVEGSEITRYWTEKRNELLAYGLDDVKETRAIGKLLSPSYFYQAQLVPMKYQDTCVRGNATRIDAMLNAEYLNRKTSIPNYEQGRAFAGALTEAFHSGVFKNVWHCDVRSLYPSIILAEKWCPKRDTLQIFPKFLATLRNFRLEAKDSEKKAPSPEERDHFNALQTTFKILINSFYGYLGFSMGTFNDFDMAEKVTSRGREILTSMLNFLEKSGAKVIEMDTDGLYFQPPSEVTSPDEMEKKVQEILPEGIEVELDATYPAMFCYKSKNYALLKDDGEIGMTGAALKSRGLEPFQRDYIHKVVTLLLNKKADEIVSLNSEYRDAIINQELPLEKIAKSETLNDSIDSYQRKQSSGKGRRSAAYELAKNSGRDYQRGDQVSFYVTGDKKRVSVVENSKLLADASGPRDENVPYYLNKLEDLIRKFEEFAETGGKVQTELGI